jgi:hypothetical protein
LLSLPGYQVRSKRWLHLDFALAVKAWRTVPAGIGGMRLNRIDGHLSEEKRMRLLLAHIVVKINHIMALSFTTLFLYCLIIEEPRQN